MIPIEIQDKIFLYFDYENLERTRELQSNYVKDKTNWKFNLDLAIECMKRDMYCYSLIASDDQIAKITDLWNWNINLIKTNYN